MKNSEPFGVIEPNQLPDLPDRFLEPKPEYFRERVEGFMLGRLTKCSETEVPVPDWLFEGVMTIINPLVESIATQRKVQGFTDDDLRSFMGMKVHQVLRRRQYDLRKPAGSFFKAVFNNMFNDLHKLKDNALKGELFSEDCLDFRTNLSEKMLQVFDEEEDPVMSGLVADLEGEKEAKELYKLFFE